MPPTTRTTIKRPRAATPSSATIAPAARGTPRRWITATTGDTTVATTNPATTGETITEVASKSRINENPSAATPSSSHDANPRSRSQRGAEKTAEQLAQLRSIEVHGRYRPSRRHRTRRGGGADQNGAMAMESSCRRQRSSTSGPILLVCARGRGYECRRYRLYPLVSSFPGRRHSGSTSNVRRILRSRSAFTSGPWANFAVLA